MISIDGLYLKVDFGDVEDLIKPSTSFEFIITEEVGNNIPLLEGNIRLPANFVGMSANEGTELRILQGVTASTAVQTSWRITNYNMLGSLFTFRARISLDYTRDRSVAVFNNDSVSTIAEVASDYFEVINNASTFNDRMRWINYGLTAQEFIDDVWRHSYSEGGLLIPAITMDGKFIMDDVRNPSDPLELGTVPDFKYRCDPNIEFIFAGTKYHRSFGVVSQRTVDTIGDYNTGSELPDPVYGDTYNMLTQNNMWQNARFQSDNIHDNYFKAESDNLTQLALMANFTTVVKVYDFDVFELLDPVELVTRDIGNTSPVDINTGLHFVKRKITRTTQKSLVRVLELAKDAITVPGMQGDLA